jgi:hypothetical protein
MRHVRVDTTVVWYGSTRTTVEKREDDESGEKLVQGERVEVHHSPLEYV